MIAKCVNNQKMAQNIIPQSLNVRHKYLHVNLKDMLTNAIHLHTRNRFLETKKRNDNNYIFVTIQLYYVMLTTD